MTELTQEYTQTFIQRLKHRYSIDSENMPISDWLEANTTLRKKPYTLTRHPFQRAIADDMHPNLSCIKPSQVGLTEVQIRKVLAWLRRNDGVSVIYTMPNDDMRNRLSQTRVRPLIENDAVFNSEFDEEAVRSKGLVQFGQSFLYLTGAKEGDATSIPADMVINDEVDLTDEEMVALFRSRLQGSDYKINQKFSTPTYPKAGVSKDYADSDQHEYTVRCEKCNHEQVPTFTKAFCHIPGISNDSSDLIEHIDNDTIGDIDLHNSYIMCEKCHEPLDLGNESLRRWVAMFPSKSQVSRGYRIRPFSSANLDIQYIVRELLEAKKRSTIRRFHNTVLGEAYIDDSIALNDDVVRQKFQGNFVYSGQPCFVGIDMGMVCHVTIGSYNSVEGWVIHHWGIVDATKIVPYIEQLCKDYNVVGGAVDRFPYTPTSIDIRSVSNGKIIPVEYRNPTELNVKDNELEPEKAYAQVNRTSALDEVAKAIRTNKMYFKNYGDKERLILRQLTDMVRVEEESAKPVWKKQTGDDHFFHSLAFMIAGKKLADHIIFNSVLDIRTMVSAQAVDTKTNSSENLYSTTTKKPSSGRFGFEREIAYGR